MKYFLICFAPVLPGLGLLTCWSLIRGWQKRGKQDTRQFRAARPDQFFRG